MATRTTHNIKLGIFVLAGMLLLILALYMIGRDSNLFGNNYELKVRFVNVQGLNAGNNVRYSGIQVGTVKKIKILADTLIEVTMLIDEKMKPFIHKNDLVSIGTDGLMGNKLLNIAPSKDNSPLAEEGDLLINKRVAGTDEILETLDRTNQNLAFISEEVKQTVTRINNSTALWSLLNDQSLPDNFKRSVGNIRSASHRADELMEDLHAIIANVKDGKGSLGSILTDTIMAFNLNEAVIKIKMAGDNTGKLAEELSVLINTVRSDITDGKGTVNALLRDTALVSKLSASLSNIEQGTMAFNQNMEALKHNFLLRGYFRKQEKKMKK
jgi:phospholipid/cholesterol/gamma-HCH transport system substrate-binding protein